MKLLITGAHGFVGVNLVRWLGETLPDATIIATDLHPPDALGTAFLAPVATRVEHTELDVTDRVAFVRLATDKAVTHLVHAAAITPSLADEQRHPAHVIDVNLGGALNALEAARQAPSITRAVLLSSSGVYGAPSSDPATPINENEPLQLDNGYSIAKRNAELLTERYATLSGKTLVAIRFAAMYGPLERSTGSRHTLSHPQQLVTALRENRAVRVGGPNVVRDWMYIEDAAAAVRAVLLASHLRYNIYNAGGGTPYTMHQLIDIFVAHGLQATWTNNLDEADIALRSDQARAPLDMTRLHADTGFVPYYSLRSGIYRGLLMG